MIGQLGQLWKMFIRPVRQEYTQADLGSEKQQFGNYYSQRTDFVLINKSSLKIQCSLYEPISFNQSENGSHTKFPCVIYCHCNSGSRLEALRLLPHIIQEGIGLFSFDFSGSGISEGEYVTLGVNESQDLECVVNYLQESGKVSNIALWGRSMGAVTNILYMGRKTSQKHVKCIVFDSGFSSMNQLALDIAKQKTGFPNMFLEPALSLVNDQVKERIHFDIQSIDLAKTIHDVYIPIHFLCSKEDIFVKSEHSERLYERYNGLKWIEHIKGGHNSNRTNEVLDKLVDWISYFLLEKKKPPFYQYFPKANKIPIYQNLPSQLTLNQDQTSFQPFRKGQSSTTSHQQQKDALRDHLNYLKARIEIPNQPLENRQISPMKQITILGGNTQQQKYSQSPQANQQISLLSQPNESKCGEGTFQFPQAYSSANVNQFTTLKNDGLSPSSSSKNVGKSQNQNQQKYYSDMNKITQNQEHAQLKQNKICEIENKNSKFQNQNQIDNSEKAVVKGSIEVKEIKLGSNQEFYSSQTRMGTEETCSRNENNDSNNNLSNAPTQRHLHQNNSQGNPHTYSFLSIEELSSNDKVASNTPQRVPIQDTYESPKDLKRKLDSKSLIEAPFAYSQYADRNSNDNMISFNGQGPQQIHKNIVPIAGRNSIEGYCNYQNGEIKTLTSKGTPQFMHLNKVENSPTQSHTPSSAESLKTGDFKDSPRQPPCLSSHSNYQHNQNQMIVNQNFDKGKQPSQFSIYKNGQLSAHQRNQIPIISKVDFSNNINNITSAKYESNSNISTPRIQDQKQLIQLQIAQQSLNNHQITKIQQLQKEQTNQSNLNNTQSYTAVAPPTAQAYKIQQGAVSQGIISSKQTRSQTFDDGGLPFGQTQEISMNQVGQQNNLQQNQKLSANNLINLFTANNTQDSQQSKDKYVNQVKQQYSSLHQQSHSSQTPSFFSTSSAAQRQKNSSIIKGFPLNDSEKAKEQSISTGIISYNSHRDYQYPLGIAPQFQQQEKSSHPSKHIQSASFFSSQVNSQTQYQQPPAVNSSYYQYHNQQFQSKEQIPQIKNLTLVNEKPKQNFGVVNGFSQEGNIQIEKIKQTPVVEINIFSSSQSKNKRLSLIDYPSLSTHRDISNQIPAQPLYGNSNSSKKTLDNNMIAIETKKGGIQSNNPNKESFSFGPFQHFNTFDNTFDYQQFNQPYYDNKWVSQNTTPKQSPFKFQEIINK